MKAIVFSYLLWLLLIILKEIIICDKLTEQTTFGGWLRRYRTVRGEAGDKVVFGDDGDAQFLGFLILARTGFDIVVDEEVGRLTDTSCGLPALTFDVSLEFLPVLVMMRIAGDDEGQT